MCSKEEANSRVADAIMATKMTRVRIYLYRSPSGDISKAKNDAKENQDRVEGSRSLLLQFALGSLGSQHLILHFHPADSVSKPLEGMIEIFSCNIEPLTGGEILATYSDIFRSVDEYAALLFKDQLEVDKEILQRKCRHDKTKDCFMSHRGPGASALSTDKCSVCSARLVIAAVARIRSESIGCINDGEFSVDESLDIDEAKESTERINGFIVRCMLSWVFRIIDFGCSANTDDMFDDVWVLVRKFTANIGPFNAASITGGGNVVVMEAADSKQRKQCIEFILKTDPRRAADGFIDSIRKCSKTGKMYLVSFNGTFVGAVATISRNKRATDLAAGRGRIPSELVSICIDQEHRIMGIGRIVIAKLLLKSSSYIFSILPDAGKYQAFNFEQFAKKIGSRMTIMPASEQFRAIWGSREKIYVLFPSKVD